MKNPEDCKHNSKQAVASPSNWGKQIASVVCLQCGQVLSSVLVDANKDNEQEYLIQEVRD